MGMVAVMQEHVRQRLELLKHEVARLKATVAVQRDQYNATAQKQGRPLVLRAAVKVAIWLIRADCMGRTVSAQDTFVYDAQQHCWTWTLECGSPVHSVALQSDAQVVFREGRGGVGILSTSPPDTVNGNMTIATMRYAGVLTPTTCTSMHRSWHQLPGEHQSGRAASALPRGCQWHAAGVCAAAPGHRNLPSADEDAQTAVAAHAHRRAGARGPNQHHARDWCGAAVMGGWWHGIACRR